MEKILEIKEIEGFKKNQSDSDWCSYDGFEIKTDKQSIKIGVSNEQSCCEDWGYFSSDDDLDQFIGSEIIEITIADTALNVEKLKENCEFLDAGDCMFINVSTTEGLLQFTAYNAHNGYYGHDAVLISDQLNHECDI